MGDLVKGRRAGTYAAPLGPQATPTELVEQFRRCPPLRYRIASAGPAPPRPGQGESRARGFAFLAAGARARTRTGAGRGNSKHLWGGGRGEIPRGGGCVWRESHGLCGRGLATSRILAVLVGLRMYIGEMFSLVSSLFSFPGLSLLSLLCFALLFFHFLFVSFRFFPFRFF